MHKIVFLDRSTIAPQIRLRRPRFEHELIEYQRTPPEEVARRLAGASIAIINKVPLPAAVLAQLPDLRLIAVAATGTDCVDKAWCVAHDIAVVNIRGYAVNTVPEHTFALILARAFAMVPLFAAYKGVSGMGPLYTPWQEMLETSDIITLHAPLSAATRGMIARPEFQAMKRRPLIVNTARGGLVDEADLVEALDADLVSGAGFDVATSEPPAPDNPLVRAARRHNVILTPHVAWASDEAQQALADQLMDNIENFVSGCPTNLVRELP